MRGGVSTEAHFLKIRRGMPSGPPAFLTFIDFRSSCTRSNEMTGKGIGHLRGEEGGRGIPESSRVELEENRRPKRLSLIHISEPTRLLSISYAVFCLKKKKKKKKSIQ